MGEFRMPSLGADMESGTIVEWRVKPGDQVRRGDIVAVVDTEKSDIEVEVFETGVMHDIVVMPGETVSVGTVLAHIVEGSAPKDETEATAQRPLAPEPNGVQAVSVSSAVVSPLVRHLAEELGVDLKAVVGSGPGGIIHRSDVEHAAEARRGFVRASPRARRRARELGIDLGSVVGSGPEGSIVEADVENATERAGVGQTTSTESASMHASQVPPTRDHEDRKLAMRRAIASLMERSHREIPHYYLQTTIDMQPALDWLASFNLERPVTERVLPAAMLLKATAIAAVEVPEMNGFWIDNSFQPASSVHLGVAIALRGGGLVAPAILDAQSLTLIELMVRLRDLVERARSGVLRASEMSAPTMSVSSLGDQGAEEVYGVIYPPQVALVGFGKITERPWALEHLIGVRSVLRATLAADHRASDGHVGGIFLNAIDRILQTPDEL